MTHEEEALGETARCGEWLGALVSLPSFVVDQGEQFRPTAVLWIETETDVIVGSELVRPEEALEHAVDSFHLATRKPLVGAPRVPRSVRVADATLAEALRGGLSDIEVVVAPTPEIDIAVQEMQEHLARGDEELTHFGPGTTAEDLSWFFRVAARLYHAQPWRVVPSDEFLSVTCAQLGMTDGALTIVGQQGTSFGFSLFRSVEDAMTFLDTAERHARGDRSGEFPQSVMLSFDPKESWQPSMQSEVETHGWEVAGPNAYPSVVMIGADLVARGLTHEELIGVTAIMETLADFVESEPALAEAWQDGEPIEWSRQVETPEGESTIALRAPLRIAVNGTTFNGDPALWTDLADDEGLCDEELYAEHREAILSQFADSPESGGRSELVNIADMLIEHAAMYHLATITAITPSQLEELLFETLPSRMCVEADAAGEIVEGLRALLAFAGRALDSASARECLATLPPDVEKRLAHALADETKFATAKRIVMAGIKAGHDLSTAEGVTEWLEIVNKQGIPGMPQVTPRKKKAAAPKRKPSAKKATAKATPKAAKPKAAKPKPKAAKPKAKAKAKKTARKRK